MKKYLSLIALIVFAVCVLGAHYIQSARAAKDLFTLKLETIDGDETVMDNITLHGHYNQQMIFQPAKVTKEGVTSPLQGTYIRGILSTYTPSEMELYIDNYRSFMRGKEFVKSFYVEDEKRLTYVNISNGNDVNNEIQFEVSTLIKDSKKETSFKPISSAPKTAWASVLDVQFVDGLIQVYVQQESRNDVSELHVYTIDEAKQKIVDDTLITQMKREEDTSTFINFYSNDTLSNPTQYLYSLHSEKYHEQITTVLREDWFVYDVATKTSKPLELPQREEDSYEYISPTNDGFYVTCYVERVLELYSYTFATGEWRQVTLEDDAPESFNQTIVIDNKIFVSTQNDYNSYIRVYDINTAALLYKGKVVNELTNNNFNYSLNYIEKNQ